MPELEGAGASVADVLPGADSTSIVDEVVEQPTTEEGGEQESAEVEQQGNQEAQAQPEAEAGDGRVLSPDLKKHLASLKAVNPQLEKKIRGTFFAERAFREQFPEGPKAAAEFKASIDQLGGLDGIKQIQQDSGFYKELDTKVEKGDPSIIDSLAEMLPADAYNALGDKFLQRFHAANPEGYQRFMSGIVSSTLASSGLQNELYLIKQVLSLGKTDEALKRIEQIEGWSQQLQDLANSKPEQKQVDPKIAEREQQLNERETKMFTDSVTSDLGAWSKSRVQKEVEPFLKGRKLNDHQFESLEQKALGKVRQSLLSNQQFSQTYQKYFMAKDRDGLLKFVKAETDKLLPGAVKESYRYLFSDFSPKPNQQTQKPGEEKPKPQATPGFVKISGPPNPDQVDLKKTDFGMRMRSQAILKNGQRVTWAQ
jgi:hypothetical protein